MTVLAHEFKASYAFVERNFFLTRRYWGWEIAFLVYSVAGALSVSLIGASLGDARLLLSLVIGAIFWNYLSVIFSWIAETIAIERWEGTLEYTMMAPVRRYTHLVGAAMYAVVYGFIHTAAILAVMVLFFPQLDLGKADLVSAAVVMTVGSFSFVGIGMMAAILPLLRWPVYAHTDARGQDVHGGSGPAFRPAGKPAEDGDRQRRDERTG